MGYELIWDCDRLAPGTCHEVLSLWSIWIPDFTYMKPLKPYHGKNPWKPAQELTNWLQNTLSYSTWSSQDFRLVEILVCNLQPRDQYPEDRLLPLMSTITDDLMRTPDMWVIVGLRRRTVLVSCQEWQFH